MNKELMVGFLTKAYNKTEDEINALIFNGDEIKENALQSLIDLDALKVRKFKDETTKAFDNGAKKREKEIHNYWESKIKEKFPEVEGQGEELIDGIYNIVETTQKSKPSKLTDDDIKKHPVFIDYEKKWKTEKENAVKEKENEFIQFKTSIERNQKISTVKSKAIDILSVLNPILPKDPVKSETQKKAFLKEFDEFDYDIPEDGNIIIIKEGKRFETDNGYPVQFNEFVKSRAESWFEFPVQDPKGGTGNKNDNKDKDKSKSSSGINMFPKSETEFSESMLKLGNDNEKIKELAENYKSYLKK